MVDARKIEQAISRVEDQSSFIQELLIDALEWPIDEQSEQVEDISYEWSADELRTEGLDEKLVDGVVRQIVLPGNPWGIFILEFKNPEVFTADRGMTGTLRKVLRGLVPSKRRDSNLASFNRENLLFICNQDYKHYRFAHFKAPLDTGRATPLAAFGWGPDDPVRTLCEFNLPALVWPAATPKDDAGWLECWGSAFDVEKVTQKFYRDYADTFTAFERYVEGRPDTGGLTGDDLRLWCQSLFNRLMFIRFIERKRWLTFPEQRGTNYLSALFEAGGCDGESFFRARLHPLFFEGLAVEGRRESDAYGCVPFLNGGLFEEGPLDAKVQDIPDDAFRAVLGNERAGGLFYSYNFTVEESTPLDIEVAVDPEMLGKVFEELVTRRHGSGSYYTPRPVVSFMCREALKGHLTGESKASPEAVATLVDERRIGKGFTVHHARQIIEALDNLKAIDPACGSGAYLLGLLHELIAIYRLVYSEKLTEDARSLYDLKLSIISHNLYGVDIDPFATNIAMLRLWLSLAVEADEPIALPNLDFKIETGDSLLGPCEPIADTLQGHSLRIRAAALRALKDKYLTAHGPARVNAKAAIDSEETAIRRELQHLRGEGVVDWHVQFAEVFGENDGFDIVLANPPYVRKENIIASSKPILRLHFAKAITGRSDLYCSFYARAVQLLRDGGMHVFVCSSAWLDAGYGAPLQSYLLKRCRICAIYDSAVEKQFSTANVNTIISVLQRHDGDTDSHMARFCLLVAPFGEAIGDINSRIETIVRQDQLRASALADGKYIGGKWGGKFLRAPPIYKRIFGEMADSFVPLSKVAQISGYIHDNNTGQAFGRKKVLWTVKDADTVLIAPGDPGVRSVGVTPTGNSRDFAPVLFPRTFGTRHLIPWCKEGVLGKEFYKIKPHATEETESIVAQLNSTIGMLQREILGIKGLGGGALKFAADDVAQFQVMPGFSPRALSRTLRCFVGQPRCDIDAELQQPDRRELDVLIFDALGLSEGERAAVYEATFNLVDSRRGRSRRVTS